ncbi:MAG: class I SAM-dependent methyltransferase [Oscillospiraceae bacterium]|nr:class I SAM-dependent methyltransferase [Oscillospiraceae bacterium]
MYNFFKCPDCKKAMTLPLCSCRYEISCDGRVYKLTDDPYIINDGFTDIKYIGFEEIGEYYSNAAFFNKTVIDKKCRNIAKITGTGILLDLACGDGLYTVPLLKRGVNIIAMDISDKMLSLLYKRAESAEADISSLVVCRANALDIPLVDGSVDAVMANSLLHLISKPEKVINEIYRVLKKGGKYITIEDKPDADIFNGQILNEQENIENKKYCEMVGYVQNKYFQILKEEYGISDTKHGWLFNQKKICGEIFKEKDIYMIPMGYKTENIFKDSFLYRMSGKGYSYQSAVPPDIHKNVFERIMIDFTEIYGDNATNTVYTEYESDVEIAVYIK